MSIRLPRAVKIGPVMFGVRRVKNWIPRNVLGGSCDYLNAQIKVRGGIAVRHQAVTLMHEIIHGTLTSIGHNKMNDDEQFVELLSESLIDTLWNSPGLLRYLKEARHK